MKINSVPSFRAVIPAKSMQNYLKNPIKAIQYDDLRKELEPMYFNDFYIEPVSRDVLQIGITKSNHMDVFLKHKSFKLKKEDEQIITEMKHLDTAMKKNREERPFPVMLGYVNLSEIPPKTAAERIIDAARFYNESVVGLS